MIYALLSRLAEHVETARQATDQHAIKVAIAECWFALHEASEAANDPNYIEAAMAARSMEQAQ